MQLFIHILLLFLGHFGYFPVKFHIHKCTLITQCSFKTRLCPSLGTQPFCWLSGSELHWCSLNSLGRDKLLRLLCVQVFGANCVSWGQTWPPSLWDKSIHLIQACENVATLCEGTEHTHRTMVTGRTFPQHDKASTSSFTIFKSLDHTLNCDFTSCWIRLDTVFITYLAIGLFPITLMPNVPAAVCRHMLLFRFCQS